MKKLVLVTSILIASVAAGSALAGPGKRFAFDQNTVYGWQLMSAQERTDHANKMHSFKTVDECKAYLEEHRKTMEARAKEQGKTLPQPRYNACDRMQARGFLK
jgi:hypothetical protein